MKILSNLNGHSSRPSAKPDLYILYFLVVYHERFPHLRDESNGGPGGICTPEGISQQIYSLPRLSTSVPTQWCGDCTCIAIGIQLQKRYNPAAFMPMNRKATGELYALAHAFVWSLFPIVAISMYRLLTPLYTAAICTLVSVVYFAVSLTIRRKWHEVLHSAVWLYVGISAVLISIGYYSLLFLSLRYTTAGNNAIISLMEVFFSFLILGVILKQETHSRKHIIGAACMILGVGIVLSSSMSTFQIGDIVMLCATMLPPVGNLFAKKARAVVGTECVMFIRNLIGGTFLTGLALMVEPSPSIDTLGSVAVPLILSGVVFFGFRIWLWVESIHRIAIAKTISLSSVGPVFTLIFAYLLLDEPIYLRQVIGIVPVLVGVYLLTRAEGKSSTPFVHPMV
jgi:drug/metabolite transporter (DMT)-like permease